MNITAIAVAVGMLFFGILIHQGYLRYILWRAARRLHQMCPDRLLWVVHVHKVTHPLSVLVSLFGEAAMTNALNAERTGQLSCYLGRRAVEGTYENGKLIKVQVNLAPNKERPLHIFSHCSA